MARLRRVTSARPSLHGRYLVTGASGFLGRHLLETLSAERPGARALALVRSAESFSREPWTGALSNVQPLEGGLPAPEGWLEDASLSGIDGIFHFAAMVRHSRHGSEELFQTNVGGTLRMVRLAAEHKCRLVFVSTSGTVGVFNDLQGAADEDAPHKTDEVHGWPYYASKVEAERKARTLANELGVELIIVRPPAMLGPGDHKFRSTGHVVKHLRRQLPFLVEGGIHFIDIRDAARAVLAAMELENPRPIYHLAGMNCSVSEFFDLCEQVSGVAAPKRRLPYGVAHALAETASWLSRLFGKGHSPLPDPVVIEMASHYWGLSSKHAEKDLGYSSRPALQTLADTVAWIRENHPQLHA